MAQRRAGQAAGQQAGQQAYTGSNRIEQQLTGSDLSAAAQTGFGTFGGFAQECPQGIDQDVALLATAAALAVGIYVVYRHVFDFTYFQGQKYLYPSK